MILLVSCVNSMVTLWSVSHVGWTEHASCCYGGCFCLRRRAHADSWSIGCSPRSSMRLWLFSFLRCGFVCVWAGTFGHMSSAIDSRHWRDPLFSSARDPIIIPGWPYINSDATWRMRTFRHTSESEEREPSTASFTNFSRVDRNEDVLYNCAVHCCSSPYT